MQRKYSDGMRILLIEAGGGQQTDYRRTMENVHMHHVDAMHSNPFFDYVLRAHYCQRRVERKMIFDE